MSVTDELHAAARELYAAAMFERDNEVRKIDDPDFEGSTWDRDCPDLQQPCRDLYFNAADRHFQSGDAPDASLQPLLDTWRWAL